MSNYICRVPFRKPITLFYKRNQPVGVGEGGGRVHP